MATGNIDIKLGLDSSGVQEGAKQVEKNLENLEKKTAEVEKSLNKVTDNLANSISNISNVAKKVKADMDVIKKGVDDTLKVGRKAHDIALTKDENGNYINLKRQTNPYKKGGTERLIVDTVNRQGKIQRAEIAKVNEEIHTSANAIKGIADGYVEKLTQAKVRAGELTREFNKHLGILKSQRDTYNKVEAAQREALAIQERLNTEQQYYNRLASQTPKYAASGRSREMLLESAGRIKSYTSQLKSVSDLVDLTKQVKGYGQIEKLFKEIGDDEGKLASEALRRASAEKNVATAIKQQRKEVRAQITEQNKLLSTEQNRLRNANRLLLLNQRRIRGYRANMRGGLTDLAYGMGGAYLGERAIGGMFGGVAELQKIESQVDTWRLNPQDRFQFDLIADRLMMSNPLLSRKESLDATLAGMTSMGHFDPEALKKVLPSAVQFAQGSKMLGYSDDRISDIIKNYFGVVEARQQTLNPEAMLKTFQTLWRIENVTGGKVTVKDFETILRNLGPGAPLLSDEGLLNLVAFAEQIKVAGHGGGGGAGAGISTVGNLIKMLQLTAAGKPTSINAKKMMSELYTIDENGNKVPILDIEKINKNEASGGMSLVQSMTSMKNIAQTTMQLLLGADKDIAKAGFREKAAMWQDPVRVMGSMREAFLRETQKNEENRRKYYGKDKVDKNGKLKDIDVLDEQAAITSLIAQMGFQHRTTAAMATFMNPFFLKRSKYTLESAGRQMNPSEWMVEQYGKGNWNVAAQEFTVAITRLEESAKPLVAIFADITRSISKFIREIAQFNENHPILTMFNGLALTLASIAPMVGMAAMGFARLKDFTNSFIQLNKQTALQDKLVLRAANARANVETAKETLDKVKTQQVAQKSLLVGLDGQHLDMSTASTPASATTQVAKAVAPKNVVVGTTASITRELKNAEIAMSGFITRMNAQLATFYRGVFSIVGKIGGLFVRLVPVIGTALMAWDLASIVGSWFGEITLTIDGETRKLSEHLSNLKQEFENKQALRQAMPKSAEYVKAQKEVNQAQTTKEDLMEMYALLSSTPNVAANTKLRTIEDEGVVSNINTTVGDVVEQAKKSGLLSEEFNLASKNLTKNLNLLAEAVKNAVDAEEKAKESFTKTKATSVDSDKAATQFSQFTRLYEDTLKRFENATIKSSVFDVNGKEHQYNLLQFQQRLQEWIPQNKEEEAAKKKELDRVQEEAEKIGLLSTNVFNNISAGLKDCEGAAIAFANSIRPLIKMQLKLQGQSELAAKEVDLTNLIDSWVYGSGKGKVVSPFMNTLLLSISKPDREKANMRTALDIEQDKAAKQAKAAGGLGAMYYVPQNVQFANNLQAQYDESMANIRTLAAGQGKKGMDYSFAVVLQKWLNGGFSLSKKNPHESPFMKTKKGGLSFENLDLTKKDQTGRRFEDYVNLHNQAEQAKITASAIEKLTQESAQAAEVYEEAADLVAQGGLEKLPTAITTLDKKIAKEMNAISDVGLRQTYQEIARVARVRTSAAELAKQTAASQQNIRAMENEARTFGMSSTNAAKANFDFEWSEKRRNNEYQINDLKAELNKANITQEEIDKIQQTILKQTETFNEEYQKALDKFYRDNKTAGQSIVDEWTDLGKQLDELQTNMMESFLSITEDYLDDNLSSWKEYATSLWQLVRRQIMQATLSPLFSILTGGINYGIASLLGNDVEAQRQLAGINQSGNSAQMMLGAMTNPFSVLLNSLINKFRGTTTAPPSPYSLRPQQTENELYQNADGTYSADNSGYGLKVKQSQVNDFGLDSMAQAAEVATTGLTGMEEQTVASTASLFTQTTLQSGLNALMSSETALSTMQETSLALLNIELQAFNTALTNAIIQLGIFAGDLKLAGMVAVATPHAKGGIMTSEGAIDLKRYAGGGIAKSPQIALFGEGRMPEAYVPLPDGRSIPVTINGGESTSERVGGNNIVININVDAGGSSTTTTATSSNGATGTASEQSQNASETSSDFTKLANRIKSIVRQEIVIQSRPGGLLASS